MHFYLNSHEFNPFYIKFIKMKLAKIKLKPQYFYNIYFLL